MKHRDTRTNILIQSRVVSFPEEKKTIEGRRASGLMTQKQQRKWLSNENIVLENGVLHKYMLVYNCSSFAELLSFLNSCSFILCIFSSFTPCPPSVHHPPGLLPSFCDQKRCHQCAVTGRPSERKTRKSINSHKKNHLYRPPGV